jgi:hypothetical protein
MMRDTINANFEAMAQRLSRQASFIIQPASLGAADDIQDMARKSDAGEPPVKGVSSSNLPGAASPVAPGLSGEAA